MSAPITGFDRLAPVYDRLARFVYGDSIVQSQTCFLARIPPSSDVLILGGGTGWLLAELISLRPQCTVWYVESSAGMLELARKKTRNDPRVRFILGTEDEIPARPFHVVITHFFLDLFPPSKLILVVHKILQASYPSTLWLVADFASPGKRWQRLLLKTMYLFFTRVCRIEARALPPWVSLLQQSGLTADDRRFFYGGFIESVLFRRADCNPVKNPVSGES